MTETPSEEEGTRASGGTASPIECGLLVMAVVCAIVFWLLGWGFWWPLLAMLMSVAVRISLGSNNKSP
jgi:hypothetical protein